MKKIALLLIATITASCAQTDDKTEFSSSSLTEKLQKPDGTAIEFAAVLKNHAGKATVIEFWASWCGDCVKSMPKLKELQAAHPEADYVFVSLDKTAEKWKAGIDKHTLIGDHYLVTDSDGMKGSFGKSIDLNWIPRYMVLDKSGKIVLYRAIETDFDTIATTLKNLK